MQKKRLPTRAPSSRKTGACQLVPAVWNGSLKTRCWAVSAVNQRVTVVE